MNYSTTTAAPLRRQPLGARYRSATVPNQSGIKIWGGVVLVASAIAAVLIFGF